MPQRFKDRLDGGRALAGKLQAYAGEPNVLVLGLPRGGVPVAYEVAKRLHVPLDIFLVRKIGVPGYEELAMGAIASGGVRVHNSSVMQSLNISQSDFDQAALKEEKELLRREREYRGDRPFPDVRGKTVILVDDGLATGSSMRAAAEALRQMKPARMIVAVPVAAAETCHALRQEVDEVVCALTPEPFRAVGLWYYDFSQITDDEVRELLAAFRDLEPAAPIPSPNPH